MHRSGRPFWTFERAALLSVALAFFSLNGGALAVTGDAASMLAGPAVVVDGDTLDVAGERVRLEGVDAPELSQTCNNATSSTWACGRDAQDLLAKMTAGQTVACDRKGADKYGRTLAVCFVEGEDLNAVLVKVGLARAFVKYSTAYIAEEAAAREQARGLWQAGNIAPWEFRQQRWQTGDAGAPVGCAIKGNVSNRGHIYHVPWSAWYDKVKIEAGRGERWFCSEAEAQAAGWRAAEQQ